MALTIEGRSRDLEGFSVLRILPNSAQRMVGPFVFLDHMGPAAFDAGSGIDVRPHPHIGLATITYLLEGSMLHRDSLGNNLEILPGDVNWMTAGRGIVHSERETIEVKSHPHRLNGIQAWVALPESMAEIAPGFSHVKRCQLPHYMHDGVQMRLIIGEAFGMTSPIKTYSPMFYLDVLAQDGHSFDRPDGDQECLVYVIDGSVDCAGQTYGAGSLLLLQGERSLTAVGNSRCLMLGGDPWERKPYLYWNFVSFSKERIERAKSDWREGRFPQIPGDCAEHTPLPGD